MTLGVADDGGVAREMKGGVYDRCSACIGRSVDETHAPGMSVGVVGCDDSGPPPCVGGRASGDMLAEGDSGGVVVGDPTLPLLVVVVDITRGRVSCFVLTAASSISLFVVVVVVVVIGDREKTLLPLLLLLPNMSATTILNL